MNVKIIDKTERPIETIYRAFRVCYSKDVPTEINIPQCDFYPKNATEPLCKTNDNKKMIEFIKDKMDLMHESPLEHCSFTFAIEGVSRITEQQLTRHRIGASYSIQSGRYTNREESEVVLPKTICDNDITLDLFARAVENARETYKELVKLGVPKEDARFILPNGIATNLIMTMNLREFRHFLAERLCVHAQWEIRELANKMLEEAEKIVPFVGYKIKKCGVTCFQCKEGK